jgi:cytochrome P450
MSDLQAIGELSSEDAQRRALQFPIGVTVSLEDLGASDCEHILDRLRETEPVSWIPALGGWLVTERETARSLLRPRIDVTVQSRQNMVRASLGRMMLTVDNDEHDRMRKPLEGPFRPREVEERFAAYVRDLANQLIDTFIADGEADIVAAFASPYAVQTAGKVIGLELGDVAQINDFYADFAGAMEYAGDPEPLRRADQARGRLDELLRVSLASSSSADSLARAVLNDSSNDLSEDELIAQLRVIMFGAVETIQASITNTLLLLQLNPFAMKEISEDPKLLQSAVDESLRMIPPVAFIERWSKEPLDLGGVSIGAHEFIGISVIAVNRDPGTFERPHSFELHRSNVIRALSFSFGEHHCLGFHLARLQTTSALEELHRRLGAMTLVDYCAPEGFAFRRPVLLRLSWSSR